MDARLKAAALLHRLAKEVGRKASPLATNEKHVRRQLAAGDPRSMEQLEAHYAVEKELANRLRHASQRERTNLYATLYDELFQRVSHHPQLTRKASDEERNLAVARQLAWLMQLFHKDYTYLEIGSGDCALACAVAPFVKQVYAVDVSKEITTGLTSPQNFELILSDGRTVPLAPNSVHVAYSNQVMEHLHPDDALEQLRNIYEVLAPGGVYLCLTPNRVNGPHDISKYFDSVATGFHLKEYSLAELIALFRIVGLAEVNVFAGIGNRYLTFPTWPFVLFERSLSLLPQRVRPTVARSRVPSMLLGIRLVGRKPRDVG